MHFSPNLFFKSWVESLKLFLPKNLKVFVLLSIKTYLQILKNLWHFTNLYYPINALIFFIMLFLVKIFYLDTFNYSFFRNWHGEFFIYYMLIYIYIRAARPSVEYKDNNYFIFQFYKYFFTYIIFWILGIQIFNQFSTYTQICCYYSFFSFFIIFALFLFDSANFFYVLSALKKTLVMWLYNFPFFLISGVLFIFLFMMFVNIYYMIIILLEYIINLFVYNNYKFEFEGIIFSAIYFLQIPFFFIIIPLYIGWLTNFYVKRLHEQFSLYYKIQN